MSSHAFLFRQLRAEKLKWFGLNRNKYITETSLKKQLESDIEEIGFKFQMNDITASIGISCFEKAKNAVYKSISNAEYYQERLKNTNKLTLLKVPNYCKPSWWIYGFLHSHPDALINYLKKNGVQSSKLWKRNDYYTCFKHFRTKRILKGIEKIQNEAIFIPNGWWVSENDRERISQLIIDFNIKGVG